MQEVNDGLDGEEGLLNLVRRLSYERPAKRARLSTYPTLLIPVLQVVYMLEQPNSLILLPNKSIRSQHHCLCGV